VQDAFAIQEEIARAVVRAIRLRISWDDGGRCAARAPPTRQAYEMLLRGRQYRAQPGDRERRAARQMFKRAMALDPAYRRSRGLAWRTRT